jgi:hypothetical protein
MNFTDTASLMRDIAPVIREYVAAELKPFVERIDALSKRSTFDGKKFGAEVAEAVKLNIERKTAPILERLERAERRFERLDQRIDAIALRGVAGVDENAIVDRAVQVLNPLIDERVRDAVAAIAIPTIDDIRPVIEAEVARAVARLNEAKPQSRSVSSMTINRKGSLVVAMDDGEYRNLGAVVEHREDEYSFEDAIANGLKALPRPETYQPC